MSTERLYFADPFKAEFDAKILRVGPFVGKRTGGPLQPLHVIVLDRTLFYPEGGGQLADRGVLQLAGNFIGVHDVQVDDSGEIQHIVTARLGEETVGCDISGKIDFDRRRDMMSQHTGQHLLSAALYRIAKAETVSARLGKETSTIDLDLASLADEQVLEVEDLVNRVLLSDHPVEAHFPTAEELAEMKLRKEPTVTDNVRVIRIGKAQQALDITPCGGTHCTRTGQVGMLRVIGTEKYKGGTRVTFIAGKRTLVDHREKHGVLDELARSFTCGPQDVPAAVAKLRAELERQTERFSLANSERMSLLAEKLLALHTPSSTGTTRIVVVREREDLGALRTLAGSLARRPDVVAIVATKLEEGGDWSVVVERGAKATFDAGKWFKQIAAEHGGKGGGRPDRAEGRLPAAVDVATLEIQ